ncbi:MAG: DUF2125 domain-containing protein [Pseudomonadota bacterium]
MTLRGSYRTIAAGLAFLAFAAHALVWRAGVAQLRLGVEAWVDDQRAAGLDVRHGPLRLGGYPFVLTARAPDVTIRDGTLGDWSTDEVSVTLLPWAPGALTLRAPKPQRLALVDEAAWTLDFPKAVARLAGDDAGAWSMQIDTGPGAAAEARPRAARSIRTDGARLRVDVADPTTLVAEAASDGFSMIVGEGGRRDDQAGGRQLSGTARVRLSGLDALALSPAAWRATGGTLRVESVALRTEDAEADLRGDVSIDASGRARGDLTVKLTNPGALVGALADAGAVDDAQAQTLTAALTLAAIAGGGVVNAPFTFQDGRTRLAGVDLGPAPMLLAEQPPPDASF